MKIKLANKVGVPIRQGMIGLFFEDINYAADGGLYAEMIENRSFEFVEAEGDAGDYYISYDGGYAWEAYEERTTNDVGNHVKLRTVMGSPHTKENPHYMRVETTKPMCGLMNQAYEGISLKQGLSYHITFWARCVNYTGNFCIRIIKNEKVYGEAQIGALEGKEETYNYFQKYELDIKATSSIDAAKFVICLEEAGIVEFDYVSMFPEDAVAGIFRKDLFDKLKALKPGFLRFPGGCIVEGNTLDNHYRFKDSLKEPWARTNNWNRWAVHGNNSENNFKGKYSHYNQTLGLGYYEYFLLCELIGAEPIPVINVGFACQYQSTEQVPVDSQEFQEFLQDAIDLIEFAKGAADTKWGAVRAKMGHQEPFGLTMLGVGNEQWQTERADFFERYLLFEEAIHAYDPDIKLIGSAGPDITSEKYSQAWEFYHRHATKNNFVYAVDEHYYVKPKWLLEHTDFYDNYARDVKVFAGEYAAHPVSGMNMPQANTLEGALAEAAFLTGVERNADVVVLASYAPLFARVGYAQWSPNMIWFDNKLSYATPSYYVQQMYATNMGDYTLELEGQEKDAVKQGVYMSASYCVKEDAIILKLTNTREQAFKLKLELDKQPIDIHAIVLTGTDLQTGNSLSEAEKIKPNITNYIAGQDMEIPGYSFNVLRIK